MPLEVPPHVSTKSPAQMMKWIEEETGIFCGLVVGAAGLGSRYVLVPPSCIVHQQFVEGTSPLPFAHEVAHHQRGSLLLAGPA